MDRSAREDRERNNDNHQSKQAGSFWAKCHTVDDFMVDPVAGRKKALLQVRRANHNESVDGCHGQEPLNTSTNRNLPFTEAAMSLGASVIRIFGA